ncbi:OLC1v1018852C1 [Oldenlandia corymbosa var. corymbosa]|uniref:OLC1v1018852C1 n=1 Tax=Oldenlandia corymbosa var. corymbosa TaxID=529605 RepID=A0AAV1ECP5_OLDCO|nr:OLC1v1018852C1 [Oldenlandia corymbosa var. corymbosa]
MRSPRSERPCYHSRDHIIDQKNRDIGTLQNTMIGLAQDFQGYRDDVAFRASALSYYANRHIASLDGSEMQNGDFEMAKQFGTSETGQDSGNVNLQITQTLEEIRNANVLEYESTFTKLSKFATKLVETDEERRIRFSQGLRLEIQASLAATKYNTFEELLDAAQHVENSQVNLHNFHKQRCENSNQWLKPEENMPTRNRNFGKKPVNSQPRSMGQKPAICNFCGKPNHSENDCWAKLNKCLKCETFQHFARDCPNFRAEKRPEPSTAVGATAGRPEANPKKPRVQARVYAMEQVSEPEPTDVIEEWEVFGSITTQPLVLEQLNDAQERDPTLQQRRERAAKGELQDYTIGQDGILCFRNRMAWSCSLPTVAVQDSLEISGHDMACWVEIELNWYLVRKVAPSDSLSDDGAAGDSESDYASCDHLHEVKGSDDGEHVEVKKFRELNPKKEMHNPTFEVDQRFGDKWILLKAFKTHAIVDRKGIHMAKNDPNFVRAHCVAGCNWEVYGTKISENEPTFEIHSHNKHTCSQVLEKNRNCNSNIVSDWFVVDFANDPRMSVGTLQFRVLNEKKISISRIQAWKAKRKALEKGLLPAVKSNFQAVSHRHCVHHLWSNFKVDHPGLLSKQKLFKIAKASYKEEFDELMAPLKEHDEAAWNWLKRQDFSFWCRELPILGMLEWLRVYLTKRGQKKREWLPRNKFVVGPKIKKRLEKYAEKVAGHGTVPATNPPIPKRKGRPPKKNKHNLVDEDISQVKVPTILNRHNQRARIFSTPGAPPHYEPSGYLLPDDGYKHEGCDFCRSNNHDNDNCPKLEYKCDRCNYFRHLREDCPISEMELGSMNPSKYDELVAQKFVENTVGLDPKYSDVIFSANVDEQPPSYESEDLVILTSPVSSPAANKVKTNRRNSAPFTPRRTSVRLAVVKSKLVVDGHGSEEDVGTCLSRKKAKTFHGVDPHIK